MAEKHSPMVLSVRFKPSETGINAVIQFGTQEKEILVASGLGIVGLNLILDVPGKVSLTDAELVTEKQ